MCARPIRKNNNQQFTAKFEKIKELYSYDDETLKRFYPYVGKVFTENTKKDKRDYPDIRRILVLDFSKKNKYIDVGQQVKDDKNPCSPASYLRVFGNVVNLDDLVCHCFIMRQINENLDYIPKDFFSENKYRITQDELKKSIDVLIHVVNWCQPDCILILGQSLNDLINDSCKYFLSKSFDKICNDVGIHCHVVHLSNEEFVIRGGEAFSIHSIDFTNLQENMVLKTGNVFFDRNFPAKSSVNALLFPEIARDETLTTIFSSLSNVRDRLVKVKKMALGQQERYSDEDIDDFYRKDFLFDDVEFNTNEHIIGEPKTVKRLIKTDKSVHEVIVDMYTIDHLVDELHFIANSIEGLRRLVTLLEEFTHKRDSFQKIELDGSPSKDRRRNNKFPRYRKKHPN